MTPEEHNLLVENNIMLKKLLAYLVKSGNVDNDFKEFAINVVANMISSNKSL